MSLFSFDAIGTQWEIETPEPLAAAVQRGVLERVEQFDAAYSRFRDDSLVARVAAAPDGGRFAFPDDAPALFGLYDRLHAATDGAVDPLVGRDLELLGYNRTYSLYADGSFTATGWYGGLPSSITVNVTLVAGVVRAVRVTPHATDPTSLDLQRRFAAAVPAVVVGKRLAELNAAVRAIEVRGERLRPPVSALSGVEAPPKAK